MGGLPFHMRVLDDINQGQNWKVFFRNNDYDFNFVTFSLSLYLIFYKGNKLIGCRFLKVSVEVDLIRVFLKIRKLLCLNYDGGGKLMA